jgi:hypothetical protein
MSLNVSSDKYKTQLEFITVGLVFKIIYTAYFIFPLICTSMFAKG